MTMKRALTIIALAAVCALAALSGSARATHQDATNGQRLAFAIKDGSGVSNIYSVRPDGDGLVRLTNTTAFDLCPALLA